MRNAGFAAASERNFLMYITSVQQNPPGLMAIVMLQAPAWGGCITATALQDERISTSTYNTQQPVQSIRIFLLSSEPGLDDRRLLGAA